MFWFDRKDGRALFIVGCICLLGYVKSQWPDQEYESTIPGGKVRIAVWDDGTRTVIVSNTNSVWVDWMRFTSNGISGRPMRPPEVILVNTNGNAYITHLTNAFGLAETGATIHFAAGIYEQ